MFKPVGTGGGCADQRLWKSGLFPALVLIHCESAMLAPSPSIVFSIIKTLLTCLLLQHRQTRSRRRTVSLLTADVTRRQVRYLAAEYSELCQHHWNFAQLSSRNSLTQYSPNILYTGKYFLCST